MRMMVFLFWGMVVSSFANAETLTGVVFQENGERAGGATVNIALLHSPPVRKVVQADNEGRFQIDLSMPDGSPSISFAARWELQGAQVFKTVDQAAEPVIIRLRQAGRLRGRLLREEDGEPVSAARVCLDTGELLVTDEKGNFSINGLPLGEHSLMAVATGRVRKYINFDTSKRPDAELELRLPRGLSVAGKVTDENGEPVPNAYLHHPRSGTFFTLGGWCQVCQANGKFNYDGIAVNSLNFDVTASAPGYQAESVVFDLEKQSESAEVVIRLKKESPRKVAKIVGDSEPNVQQESPAKLRRRTVRGYVRDGDGKPVGGAEVRWGPARLDRTIVPPVTTDIRGRFILEEVPEGPDMILVIADGYSPAFQRLNATARPFDQGIDVVLNRGTEVFGVVRSPDGKPIQDVHVTPVRGRVWITERSVKTNEKGEFKIDALAEGFHFDFLKTGCSEQRSVPLKYGGFENVIELESVGVVGGAVVDENGKPVRNFNIRVGIPRQRERGENFGNYYAGFGWSGVSFTRDDGTFVLSGLNVDHWMRLIVRAPGVGFAISDRNITSPLDQLPAFDENVLRLEKFKPLSVHVVDAKSKLPLPNATVMFLEDQPEFPHGFSWGYDVLKAIRSRTGDSGEAIFPEPACKDGTLAVLVPGYARKYVAWAGEAQEVTFELDAASVLSGVVRFRDKVVKVGGVGLSNGSDSYYFDLSNSGGTFTFDQISAGDYELSVSDLNGENVHTQQINVKKGEQKKITIEIPESTKFDFFG